MRQNTYLDHKDDVRGRLEGAEILLLYIIGNNVLLVLCVEQDESLCPYQGHIRGRQDAHPFMITFKLTIKDFRSVACLVSVHNAGRYHSAH